MPTLAPYATSSRCSFGIAVSNLLFYEIYFAQKEIATPPANKSGGSQRHKFIALKQPVQIW